MLDTDSIPFQTHFERWEVTKDRLLARFTERVATRAMTLVAQA